MEMLNHILLYRNKLIMASRIGRSFIVAYGKRLCNVVGGEWCMGV